MFLFCLIKIGKIRALSASNYVIYLNKSIFIPQLLTYPNPEDPLNIKAADIMQSDPDQYKLIVKSYNDKYGIITNK